MRSETSLRVGAHGKEQAPYIFFPSLAVAQKLLCLTLAAVWVSARQEGTALCPVHHAPYWGIRTAQCTAGLIRILVKKPREYSLSVLRALKRI